MTRIRNSTLYGLLHLPAACSTVFENPFAQKLSNNVRIINSSPLPIIDCTTRTQHQHTTDRSNPMERERDRQRDRETERQRERQRERDRERETDRERERRRKEGVIHHTAHASLLTPSAPQISSSCPSEG